MHSVLVTVIAWTLLVASLCGAVWLVGKMLHIGMPEEDEWPHWRRQLHECDEDCED